MTDLQDPFIEGRIVPNTPDDDPRPVDTYDPPPYLNGNGHRTTAKPKRDAQQILPHDLDAERQLLGAALIGAPAALDTVPDDAFYAPGHGHIAHAIRTLTAQSAYLDPVTVGDQLANTGLLDAAGGRPILATLLAGAPASSAAHQYADIVLRHHRARQLITAARHLEHTVRTDGPDAAHDLIQPLLDTAAPTTTQIAWEDVGAVARGDYEPMRPTMLTRTDGQALVYPGLLHWIMGEPGKGKTWVALHLTAEELKAGHHVMYLDWEGNRQIIGERLTALGVLPEEIDEYLHYLRPPTITRALAHNLTLAAATTGTTVTICDGVAKALARNDLNEDKAADVLRWLELVATPICDTGSAVVCLDHVTKDRETRGLWPRGSGAKQGEVSGAAWVVKPRTAFSRHGAGEITLVQAKDREGHVGLDGDTVARIRIAPSKGGTKVAISVEPPAAGGDVFRPTHLMELISIEIEAANKAGGTPNTNSIFSLVPGKKEHKQLALKRLVDEGHITHQAGPRNSLLHTSTKPYRKADDPLDDSYQTTPDSDLDDGTDERRWDDF